MSKSLTKKIVIVILIILLFSFVVPLNSSQAISLAGVINKPITQFLMLIIDGINSLITLLLHGATAFDEVTVGFSTEDWDTFYNSLVDPSKIFAGIPMLDANIFKAGSTTSFGTSGDSLGVILKQVVSGTYEILRNLAAVILLVLLIYTGIRIVLASNSAQEKAKWQVILLDWVKALALVIFVHVIMISVFWISEKLVAAIVGATSNGHNFIAQIRYAFRDLEWDGAAISYWLLVIMYGYITWLTIVFAVAYLKRLMYIVILIVIAPIVSVIYALGGQQKQIFSTWLKEYIMAVLLQPYHMLIYYILISLPLNMLGTNVGGNIVTDILVGDNAFATIYALVAMSFIRPAERMLRDLFGMNQGVAAQGSYDSGKATIDNAVDTVKQVGTTVAMMSVGLPPELAGAGGMEAAAGIEGMEGMEALDAASQGAETANTFKNGNKSPLSTSNQGMNTEGNGQNQLTWKQYATERKALREMSQEENLSEADQAALKELEDELEQAEITDVAQGIGTAGSNGGTLNVDSLNVGTLNAGNVQGEQLQANNGAQADGDIPPDELKTDDIPSQPNTENANNEEQKSLADKLADRILHGNPTTIPGYLGDKVKDKLHIAEASDKFEKWKKNPKSGIAKITVAGIRRAEHIGKLVRSSEGQKALGELGKSFSNLRNTMYLPGKTPDGSGRFFDRMISGASRIAEDEKKQEEISVSQFVENDNNINIIKQNHKLTGDKADEKAKAILKDAAQFLKFGVTDANTADKLLTIKKQNGLTAEQAIQQYSRSDEHKGQVRYNSFMNNSVHINAMREIVEQRVAARENVSINQVRSDQNLSRVVREEIGRELKNAAPYIASGTARNASDVVRLNNLEKAIKEKANVAKDADIKRITESTEKIIAKALKEGVADIKIPNSDKNSSIKAVEKIANEQLQEMRRNKGNA